MKYKSDCTKQHPINRFTFFGSLSPLYNFLYILCVPLSLQLALYQVTQRTVLSYAYKKVLTHESQAGCWQVNKDTYVILPIRPYQIQLAEGITRSCQNSLSIIYANILSIYQSLNKRGFILDFRQMKSYPDSSNTFIKIYTILCILI